MMETDNTAIFTREDMVRKVAALLNTAESYALQGNDEAAQAYVQKAHVLQQKYSINQALLQEATGHKVEKIISKNIQMPGKYGKSKVGLAHVIAKRTQCTGYFTRTYPNGYDKPKVYVYVCFGFESDVDYVEYLINSLCHQADQQLKRAVLTNNWDHGKSFAVSFYQGFTNTISFRLHQATQTASQEHWTADQTSPTSTALVLINKGKQVEEEMRAQVGRLGKSAPSQTNSRSGYSAGREAGQKATISRGSVVSTSTRSLNR